MTPPKTRRPRGTGSIYQRKSDQLWVGSVIVGTRPDGRPDRRAVYAKTKSDAQRKMRDVMRQRDRGELGDSGNTRATIQQWSEAWLTMHAHKVRPKTLATDRGVVRKWIVPTIGRRRLADLTPADVRKLRDAVTDAGNTTTTAAHAQRTLMTMLKAAVREGLTVPPRVFLVDMPSKSVNDRSAIPVDQALAMLRVARERPDATRWVAALLQGMRQGEALGLTWDCVNLDAGLLDVSWQLQSLTKGHATPDRWEARHLVDGYWLTRPKTNAGQRLIPLVPWMRAALVEARSNAVFKALAEASEPTPEGAAALKKAVAHLIPFMEEEKKLVDAGTHVRVKVTKKQYKPRERKDSPPAPLKLERQNGRYKQESESETEDTETEVTESEYEEERPRARQARREMKKTLRVVEKVDAVLNQVHNPYFSMLSNRWR
mgnify:CR=1 FL=1